MRPMKTITEPMMIRLLISLPPYQSWPLLAQEVGMSRTNLSRIVNVHQAPHLKPVLEILDVLGFELVVRKRK